MELTAYEHLMGKSRGEVISDLGLKFNDYYNQIWIYRFKQDMFGRRGILIIVFKKDRVVSIYFRNPYYTLLKR